MGRTAAALPVVPVSVIVFGSFARGEAGAASDIDVLFVRPRNIDESNEAWAASVDDWRNTIRRVSGNRVEVLEVASDEIAARLSSGQPVWRDIWRDGLRVHGVGVDRLRRPSDV
jgi:predicted nucleotidyltransferase